MFRIGEFALAELLHCCGRHRASLAVADDAATTTDLIWRNFEPRGVVRGVSVYDDHSRRPDEIAAALRTARQMVRNGRVIAVHQPRLFTYTQSSAGEIARTYERLADHTIVLDVYGGSEAHLPGVTGALVAKCFDDPMRVDYLPYWQEAADRAAAIAREGDIIVTLGGGDIHRLVPQLLQALNFKVPLQEA